MGVGTGAGVRVGVGEGVGVGVEVDSERVSVEEETGDEAGGSVNSIKFEVSSEVATGSDELLRGSGSGVDRVSVVGGTLIDSAGAVLPHNKSSQLSSWGEPPS